MLCRNEQSSRIMYHGLSDQVNIARVIFEKKPAALTLIRRRLIKLGIARTFGQLLFVAFNRLLSRVRTKKIKQLIELHELTDKPIPTEIVAFVDSINSNKTIDLLKQIAPDAIVVNGTRIISSEILSSIHTPFINTHMGITPKYRGVHGGYWALANVDAKNCGVTIHLVDKGIDTGAILYQAPIHPDKQDSINSYPIHQLAKAIPLMVKAVNDAKHGELVIKPSSLPSYLWHHPTLTEYIKNWIFRGVK